MIDMTSFNKFLNAVWVKKYLDNEKCGHWKLSLTRNLINMAVKRFCGVI